MKENKIDTITNLFEGSEIRSIWDSEKEDYYFSVVDVISALTESNMPKRYWTDLKKKLIEEGSQLYENIVRLKMKATAITNNNSISGRYVDTNKQLKEK